MVCGGNPAKCSHGFAVQSPCVLVDGIIVIVVQNGRGQRKGPVLELLGNPVIGFRILPLEAHVLRHRLVHESHGQGNHCPVTGHVPCRFYAFLHQVQLVKGIKQGQIFVRRHGFFLDKMVFGQVYRLIVHKGRRGGQSGHQPQQAVPGDKLHDRLFHFCFRLASHHQHSHIQRIQHNVGDLFQRIVDIRLCTLAGGDIPLAIFCRFQLVVIVPHPMGTGLFKQIFHHTRPFSLIVPIIRGGFSFFCAWSCSPAGSRRLYPVSWRFSSIPPKTGAPARSSCPHAPAYHTDGHTSGAAISCG